MPYVHCYFCDLTYRAPDSARGKQVACRNCFRKLDVPFVDAPPPHSTPSEAELKLVESDQHNVPGKGMVSPTKPPEKKAAQSSPKPSQEPRPASRSHPPAAPKAREARTGKPPAKPASAAESDRWDFEVDDFIPADIDSDEFDSLPPAVGPKKKKSARWKWKFEMPQIGGLKPDPNFAPFAGAEELWVYVNALAALVMLPLGLLEPMYAAYIIYYGRWVFAALYFIDCTFAGGLARVFLFYSVPGILLAFDVTRSWRVALFSLWGPYVLYVRLIRFKHFWPVDILFGITCAMLGLAYKVSTDIAWYQWSAKFKADWLGWLY